MCVIIHLPAGAKMLRQHLFNACANNPHGFGLILKDADAKKIQVIRKFDEKGNDPDEIIKLINDNEDVERLLHVRYSTKGATNEENTQPFQAFHSDRRQVWFAHNGTLNAFGTSNYGQTSGTGKSDSYEFNEKILIPSLSHWHGENGYGDYTDEAYLKLIIDKQWTSHSKGVLFSNDLPALRFGTGWTQYKHTEGETSGEIWVSNTDYFDRLSRGPIFLLAEKLKREQEQEEARKRQEKINSERNGNQSSLPFYQQEQYYLPSGDASDAAQGCKVWANNNGRSDKVIKAFNDVADAWDFSDPEEVALLSFVTFDEWRAIVQKSDILVLAVMLQSMGTIIHELVNQELPEAKKRIDDLVSKLERATKKIASMKKEVIDV